MNRYFLNCTECQATFIFEYPMTAFNFLSHAGPSITCPVKGHHYFGVSEILKIITAIKQNTGFTELELVW